MKSGIKGILVGCDDEKVRGYEWVINNNDWDNGSMEITSRLSEYKNMNDFKIYFYVFKTPTEIPANSSDEYRGTVFGRAEIENVEPFRNNPKMKYQHHVKLKNLELFQPKIKLKDIQDKLENYGWTEEQEANLGVNISHHGLLLTEKDCKLLNKLVSKNVDDIININNNNVNNVWFFIANPKDINNWNDTKKSSWIKVGGYIPWGIPDKSRDIDILKRVKKDDIILCYHAFDREIIGCCKCKRAYYYKDESDEHSNHIDISDVNFKTPISLDELKKEDFKFIDDYLNKPIPRGRSVVSVPQDDWKKFKKMWGNYQKC